MSVQINRTSLQLYRDCMRLAAYIAPRSTPKGAKLRAMITEQFRAHRFETDPTKVEECKQAAIRGLTNYLAFDGLSKASPEYAKSKLADDDDGEEQQAATAAVSSPPQDQQGP
ncbi:Complex 1 LYR protein domain-containing protein [Plasmodiophora brassicae]|uniref:Complex 1 LYR protein domain-containing protein n=1 Tax=Plasmodiophora brassicae TaxID=37360 RepID=A0A0G4IIV7_PLABS|nr:hypothetical protein PBRA_003889 [Plasmodiophora brassicae]SPQ96426.1 unnamed protein product [Plasmodiophora brassicae]